MSTGLKPYLSRLDSDKMKKEFEMEVLNRIEHDYSPQKNGKVILPFNRLFFTGQK